MYELLAINNGSFTVALFRFTQTFYDVAESESNAAVTIQLISGELTFDINVTVATVRGGNATSKYITVIILVVRADF